MIRFNCASCRQQYQIGDEKAGLKSKCKKCGAVITIPAAEGEIELDEAPISRIAPVSKPIAQKSASTSISRSFSAPPRAGSPRTGPSVAVETGSMDPADLKRIDTLYRNVNQMPLLAGLGVIIPILTLIGCPLGFVYASWRKKLLAAIDSGELEIDEMAMTKDRIPISVAKQVQVIRKADVQFYWPTIVLGCQLLFLLYMYAKLNS